MADSPLAKEKNRLSYLIAAFMNANRYIEELMAESVDVAAKNDSAKVALRDMVEHFMPPLGDRDPETGLQEERAYSNSVLTHYLDDPNRITWEKFLLRNGFEHMALLPEAEKLARDAESAAVKARNDTDPDKQKKHRAEAASKAKAATEAWDRFMAAVCVFADEVCLRLASVDEVPCTLTVKGGPNVVHRVPNRVKPVLQHGSFPVCLNEYFRPAVVEALKSSGDGDAETMLTEKLNGYAELERRHRDQAMALGTDAPERADRARILSLLLVSTLFGEEGVQAYPAPDLSTGQIVTERPNPAVLRSQREQNAAQLTEVYYDERNRVSLGQSYIITPGERVLLGRSEADDYRCINVPYVTGGSGSSVSRSHAVIEFLDGTWQVRDFPSSFGTAICRKVTRENAKGVKQTVMVGVKLEGREFRQLYSGDILALSPQKTFSGSWGPNSIDGFSFRFDLL